MFGVNKQSKNAALALQFAIFICNEVAKKLI